ncbi:hypothetical protein [Marinobacter sp.]|uniref:hypothetical protein n=1 Tax=Marinobacter sp. TaxID=50741 RepID=UPI000C95CCC2|nr:hypothetical protein [Marinobacter sp.]MAB50954.1 hypothetical protein [Marinobacter sp.]|tara:strand:+ start:393 stop:581 length:189 start_codon:yes stop_codon:yes gene_type:complete
MSTKLSDHKNKIMEEIPFIDIKPYSHTIISLRLKMIYDEFGSDVANETIEEFRLDELGWEKS